MTVTGVWTNHPSYGPSLRRSPWSAGCRRRREDIAAYLASGILKGIGPATAQRLVDRFGADTLAVIEEEPERLQPSRGITAKRAMELSAAFRELTGLKRVMEFLARYELPVPLAMQLYRAYGAQALPRLREDPYLLTGQAYGVAFSHHGRDRPEHGLRRRQPLPGGGRPYIRAVPQSEQRPCVPAPGQAAFRLRPADWRQPDTLETALDGLLARASSSRSRWRGAGLLSPAPVSGGDPVARRLLSLRDAPRQTGKNVDKIIAEMERQQGIAYAPQQRRAVELAARSRGAAADRRPRHRQDHLHPGHRDPAGAHGPDGAAAGPPRAGQPSA